MTDDQNSFFGRIVHKHADGVNRPQSTMGTTVMAGDTELKGLVGLTVNYAIDDVVRADARLLIVPEDVTAAMKVTGMHPITGDVKPIRRIEFEDGTYFDTQNLIDATSITDTSRRFAVGVRDPDDDAGPCAA